MSCWPGWPRRCTRSSSAGSGAGRRAMNKLWKVTAHEFRRTAANKAFVILTILGPFLITAMGVLPTLISTSGGQRVIEIAALGTPEPLYREVAPALEVLKIRLVPW